MLYIMYHYPGPPTSLLLLEVRALAPEEAVPKVHDLQHILLDHA